MKCVLIVDDSSFARMVVRRCLEMAAASSPAPPPRVLEASDGQAGLGLLRDNPDVDLIVSDLNMPVMDGTTMLRRVRACPWLDHVPIVIVSSLVNDERREELTRLGASVVVNKPITPRMMLSIYARLEERA